MKKIFVSLSILLAAAFTTGVNAQMSVGTSAAPNANAVLDLVSGGNRGLLLPRVALQATNLAAPLSAHVAGMHVYNTVAAGTAPNNVTPGEYYNDGTRWQRVAIAEAISTPVIEVTGSILGYLDMTVYDTWTNIGTVSLNLPAAGVYFINTPVGYNYYSGCGDMFLRWTGNNIVAQSADWRKQLCAGTTSDWFNAVHVITVSAATTLRFQYFHNFQPGGRPTTPNNVLTTGGSAIKLQ